MRLAFAWHGLGGTVDLGAPWALALRASPPPLARRAVQAVQAVLAAHFSVASRQHRRIWGLRFLEPGPTFDPKHWMEELTRASHGSGASEDLWPYLHRGREASPCGAEMVKIKRKPGAKQPGHFASSLILRCRFCGKKQKRQSQLVRHSLAILTAESFTLDSWTGRWCILFPTVGDVWSFQDMDENEGNFKFAALGDFDWGFGLKLWGWAANEGFSFADPNESCPNKLSATILQHCLPPQPQLKT